MLRADKELVREKKKKKKKEKSHVLLSVGFELGRGFINFGFPNCLLRVFIGS